MEPAHRGNLKKMGFRRMSVDYGVYVEWDGENRVWLALYTDDVFLTFFPGSI